MLHPPGKCLNSRERVSTSPNWFARPWRCDIAVVLPLDQEGRRDRVDLTLALRVMAAIEAQLEKPDLTPAERDDMIGMVASRAEKDTENKGFLAMSAARERLHPRVRLVATRPRFGRPRRHAPRAGTQRGKGRAAEHAQHSLPSSVGPPRHEGSAHGVAGIHGRCAPGPRVELRYSRTGSQERRDGGSASRHAYRDCEDPRVG